MLNGNLSRAGVVTATTVFMLGSLLLFSPTLKAQPSPTPTPEPPPSKCVDHDQDKCIQVRVAPMAPQIVSDTFGKRIAQNFVAIQVTVGNHDKEYQYLINDVSLWIEAKNVFTPAPPSDFFFSSAELSMLRGVAEKGQGQDTRNKVLRMFRGIGTVAAGLIGVAGFGRSYGEAVAIFNGPVINAYSEAFPDYTINQMNRLSDSAYSANTLVPAKHSKVMVAFIPLAIFLSKQQRKLFWDDPTSLYPDPVTGKCMSAKTSQCVDFRRISVYIDGDFITEVSNMPPIVSTVQFLDTEIQKFENEKPVVKGAVMGRFLTGTAVDLENVPEGISITRDGEPAGDRLNFIIKSSKPVPPDTKLNFIISNAQGTERFMKEVRYLPGPPTLSNVDPPTGKQDSEMTLTLTGTNFIPGPGRTKVQVSGGDVDVSDPFDVLGTSLKVTITIRESAAPTTRQVTVVNDHSTSAPKTFKITPKPPSP